MNKLTSKQTVLYVLSIIILFCIPIYTIFINSNTLKDGTEHLFKVRTFDPYDMFRGNYLNISFEQNSVKGYSTDFQKSNNSNSYYVTIGEDSDGFAYFDSISTTKPKNTTDYFKTGDYYNTHRIDTPTRYYMNEKKSLRAEQIYRENMRDTYVKVRVKDGNMVIVGIYVNGVLIDTID